MEKLFTNLNDMQYSELKILSYHKFSEEDNDYVFSRTYKQFRNDLSRFDFDMITIDDGDKSIMKACKIMEEMNHRAKIFVPSALIGTPGYCTWDDLWHLSRRHDIGNHSHEHVKLTELPEDQVRWNIKTCSDMIREHTNTIPRFFVPPWNQRNSIVERVAAEFNLILLKDRVNMRNDS